MSHQAESAFHTSARSWALLTIALELDSPKHIAQVPFSSIANSKTQVYFLYFIFTICILTFVEVDVGGKLHSYLPERALRGLCAQQGICQHPYYLI